MPHMNGALVENPTGQMAAAESLMHGYSGAKGALLHNESLQVASSELG
jgi:hypothetical protein